MPVSLRLQSDCWLALLESVLVGLELQLLTAFKLKVQAFSFGHLPLLALLLSTYQRYMLLG
jgi:hypothetical protein